MSSANFPVLLPALDGPVPKLGDGVSRPMPKERTRDYYLEVKIPNASVMRVLIKAPTQAKAITYAKNRWPLATVTPIKK